MEIAASASPFRNDGGAVTYYLNAAFQVEVKNANSASPAITPAPNTSIPRPLAKRSHTARQTMPISTAQPASGNGDQQPGRQQHAKLALRAAERTG